jgi:hypothetical protein
MSKARKRRSNRLASEWRELVAQWEASTETASSFCARHGIGRGSLYMWKSRLQREGVVRDAFVPVTVRAGSVEERATNGCEGWVEVVARGGRMVRVHGAVGASVLSQVLEAVERC